jgi:hypothetical protein
MIRQTLEQHLSSDNPYTWDLDEIVHDAYWQSDLTHPIEAWEAEMRSLFNGYAKAWHLKNGSLPPTPVEVEDLIQSKTGRAIKSSTDSVYLDFMAVS